MADLGALPDLTRYHTVLSRLNTIRLSGRVVQVVGLTIEATGLDCQIGEVCEIQSSMSGKLMAEVVGFREQRILLMPLGEMQGIQPGFPYRKFLPGAGWQVALGAGIGWTGQTHRWLGRPDRF